APADPPVLHSFPTRRSSDLESPSYAKGVLSANDGIPQRPQPVDVDLYDVAGFERERRVWHQRRASGEDRTIGEGVLSEQIVDERSEEHTSELQSRFDLVCRL